MISTQVCNGGFSSLLSLFRDCGFPVALQKVAATRVTVALQFTLYLVLSGYWCIPAAHLIAGDSIDNEAQSHWRV